ncbi:RidA family protein [Ferrovibrio xuzhouensis]|uniref:RidA family protein n=1 Tax=Ferrovibrio xuzhouensis TaxID=1576914 RepID=A0ABV7VCY7_9PROT
MIEHIGGPVLRGGQAQPITPVIRVDAPLVFVAGQVPMVDGRPAAPDIAGQTRCVIGMIETELKKAGCGLGDVVKVTVWLTDKDDYPAFNATYAEIFGTRQPPTRSTVISGLIAPVRIEMEVIAAGRRA